MKIDIHSRFDSDFPESVSGLGRKGFPNERHYEKMVSIRRRNRNRPGGHSDKE